MILVGIVVGCLSQRRYHVRRE